LRLLVSRPHRLYFQYAAHHRNIVFWSHHVDHSSRLVSKLVKNDNHTTNN
jgi:hypothetical protein